MGTFTLFLIVVMILAFCSTIYFSIVRRKKGAAALLFRSYMNLSMGVLFAALSIHLFTFTLPVTGKIFAGIILLLGVINVYYAIKIKRFAQQQMSETSTKS